MSAMEITDRRSSTSGELVFWRGRDGDGRETYAATWSIGGVAQEPTSDAVCYSQLAAMEVASRDVKGNLLVTVSRPPVTDAACCDDEEAEQ